MANNLVEFRPQGNIQESPTKTYFERAFGGAESSSSQEIITDPHQQRVAKFRRFIESRLQWRSEQPTEKILFLGTPSEPPEIIRAKLAFEGESPDESVRGFWGPLLTAFDTVALSTYTSGSLQKERAERRLRQLGATGQSTVKLNKEQSDLLEAMTEAVGIKMVNEPVQMKRLS